MGLSKLEGEITHGPPELRWARWPGRWFGADRSTDCSLRPGEGDVLIAVFAAALSLKWVLTVFAVDKPWLERCVFGCSLGTKPQRRWEMC